MDDGIDRDPEQQRYRLLTTILVPEQAPAGQLGALYHERWELENTLDELKVHQRGPRVVLRSKAPDGVYQEAVKRPKHRHPPKPTKPPSDAITVLAV